MVMMVSPLLILCLWLSPMLSQTQEKVPKLYQFHPYQQPLYHFYHQYQQRHQQHHLSENRRHQRTLLPPRNLRNPAIKLRNTVSSKHFSSPSYRFTPQSQRRPVLTERQQRLLVKNPVQRYQRKPILTNPSERLRPRIVSQKKQFQVKNNRETRKIANTHLKLGGNFLNNVDGKQKFNVDRGTAETFPFKKDELAIESNIVETKVKIPTSNLHTSKAKHETKPQLVKKPAKVYTPKKVKLVEVPINRNYNSVPAAPKFIIKQAGPSQQFGWVGHGTYAPLDIPNIFKAAGINTRWIPEVNEIFEAGLTYPAAPSPVAQDKFRIVEPVQQAKAVQSYSASIPRPVKTHDTANYASAYATPASAPTYKSQPAGKAATTLAGSSYEAPAPAPAYKAPVSATAPPYEAPAAAPAYKAPVSATAPPYKAPAAAPAYKAPVSASAPSYKAPVPAPAYKAPVSAPVNESPVPAPAFEAPAIPVYIPTYEAPAFAPAYKAPSLRTSYSPTTPAPAIFYSTPSSVPTYSTLASVAAYSAPALKATLTHISSNSYKDPVSKYSSPFSLVPSPQPSISTPQKPVKPFNSDSYGSQTIDLYSPSKLLPVYKPKSTTKPISTYGPSSTFKQSPTYRPSPTYKPQYKPSTTIKPSSSPTPDPINYSKTSKIAPSIQATTAAPLYRSPTQSSPFYGSPTPYANPVYGSPTPSSAPFSGSPTPSTNVFYESPKPSASSFYESPTPSIFQSTSGEFVPQPSYKPNIGFSKPSKPFTAFIGSPAPASSVSDSVTLRTIEASPKDNSDIGQSYKTSQKETSPIVGIIEVEDDKKSNLYQNELEQSDEVDDGEVFYIFYENEETPSHSVQTGLDLQRYIHEEISKHNYEDSVFSASVPQGEIFNDQNNVPVFHFTEEENKPEPPIFYDVPIKIEETGEGFDPPTEIRTIYVPIENAINIPDSYDINVGTSFGYNENTNQDPVSSFDASITQFNHDKEPLNVYESPGKKALRRVRKPKPSSNTKSSQQLGDNSFSSIPFGTRLGPRDQYDPLIIKR